MIDPTDDITFLCMHTFSYAKGHEGAKGQPVIDCPSSLHVLSQFSNCSCRLDKRVNSCVITSIYVQLVRYLGILLVRIP